MDTTIQSSIFRKCQNVHVIDLGDEGVIYKENSNDEKFIANMTAMAIWDLLDGQRTSQEIAREIANVSETEFAVIETGIYNQLAQLEKIQLIEKIRVQ